MKIRLHTFVVYHPCTYNAWLAAFIRPGPNKRTPPPFIVADVKPLIRCVVFLRGTKSWQYGSGRLQINKVGSTQHSQHREPIHQQHSSRLCLTQIPDFGEA